MVHNTTATTKSARHTNADGRKPVGEAGKRVDRSDDECADDAHHVGANDETSRLSSRHWKKPFKDRAEASIGRVSPRGSSR